ncbi:MAG: YeeE/YedE thiosulfate transporter family protein [Conexivisphaerales archaeon]
MTIEIGLATLAAGFVIGYLWQRSKSCSISGYRDFYLFRDTLFMRTIVGMALGALVGYLLFFRFSPYMADFPLMLHNEPGAGSLATLTLAVIGGLGYAFFSVLAEGCPLRQHVNATTGNGAAIIYIVGFYVGILFFQIVMVNYVNVFSRLF